MTQKEYLLLMTIDTQQSKSELIECEDCKKKVGIINIIQERLADITRLKVCTDCMNKYRVLGVNYSLEVITVDGFRVIKNDKGVEYVEVPCMNCRHKFNIVLKSEYDKNSEYFKNLKEVVDGNKTAE